MGVKDTYSKLAHYYDRYVESFNDDIAIYRSNCIPGDNILEIGCGTGRILKELLDEGYYITGVDISDDMLVCATNKLEEYIANNRLRLENHNFIDKPYQKKFNKVFITFYTYNYILDSTDTFLSNVYTSMESSSKLIIDLFYPKSLYDKQIENKWVEKEICYNEEIIKLKDKRSYSGKIEKRIQVFKKENEITEIETLRRYYSPGEIMQLLINSGFSNIEYSVGYSNRFYSSINEQEIITNYIVKALKV